MTKQTPNLMMLGDFSKLACAYRVKVAIKYAGISHSDLAARCSVGRSSISNMINGDQFPGRSVEDFFYRFYGIDFNFFRAGDLRGMSADVVEKLVRTAQELGEN